MYRDVAVFIYFLDIVWGKVRTLRAIACRRGFSR